MITYKLQPRQFVGLFLFTVFILFTSCVTVQIGPQESESSEDVSYQEPKSPFEEDSSAKQVDKAWRSRKNSNAISFVSECNNKSDPKLDTIKSGLLNQISEYEIIEENLTKFNQRAALEVKAKGKVDGVSTRFDLMIFKKNGCIYVISYVSLPRFYKEDIETYQDFLRGFKAG